jgi:hypothetical protein
VESFGAGTLAGYLWRGGRERLVSVWRVRDALGNDTMARIALAPAHGYDVQIGNTVDLSGYRKRRDHTLRVSHARNRRNRLAVPPRFVSTGTWVVLGLMLPVPLLAALQTGV